MIGFYKCLRSIQEIFLFCILIIVLPVSGYSDRGGLSIGTDQAYWYPFTYSQNNDAKGIHIDIVQTALTNLNYKVLFYPRPWKRCLQDAKDGKYDAIVSASYKPERARFLIYPDDAATNQHSKWRITQVEYVVITNYDVSYTFDNKYSSLPRPVRVPLGYSIADDLKSAGIAVIEYPDPIDCVRQLIRSKKGSFVTPPENAIGIQLDDRFKGKLTINPKPLKSKSYFIAFSREGQRLTQQQIEAIWKEIARLREDHNFMRMLFQRYNGQ